MSGQIGIETLISAFPRAILPIMKKLEQRKYAQGKKREPAEIGTNWFRRGPTKESMREPNRGQFTTKGRHPEREYGCHLKGGQALREQEVSEAKE